MASLSYCDETNVMDKIEDEGEVALTAPFAPLSSNSPFSPPFSSSFPRSLFDRLPDDLAALIFDFLSTLSLLRLSARPPSKSFASLAHRHTSFEIDLDREMLDLHKRNTILSNRDSSATSTSTTSSSSNSSSSLTAGGKRCEESTGRDLQRIKQRYTSLISVACQFAELHTLTLSGFGVGLTDAEIQPLLTFHGSTLLHVNLSGNNLMSPQLNGPQLLSIDLSKNKRLQSPQLYCPILTELNLSRTFINDLDLQKCFSTRVPPLRTLCLHSCKNVRSLPLALPDLRILDLSNTAVSDEAVSRIVSVEACSLQVLFVNQCNSLRAPTIRSQTLTVLSCKDCEMLREPILACFALQELDLSGTGISDHACALALDALPSLSVLSLRSCFALSAPDLSFTLPCLSSLDLSLSTINTHGIHLFMQHAPQLQALQFAQCTKVIEALVPYEHTFNSESEMALRVLNVKSTYVTSTDLHSISSVAPALCRLLASECINVAVIDWFMPHLHTLDLSHCILTDQALQRTFESCPVLVNATFDHCNELLSPNVTHPSLVVLQMNWCRSMESLKLSCSRLEQLDLSHNTSLTILDLDTPSLTVIQAHDVSQYAMLAVNERLAKLQQQVEVRIRAFAASDLVYKQSPRPQGSLLPWRNHPHVPIRSPQPFSLSPSPSSEISSLSPSSIRTPSSTRSNVSSSPQPSPSAYLSTTDSNQEIEPEVRRSSPQVIEHAKKGVREQLGSRSFTPNNGSNNSPQDRKSAIHLRYSSSSISPRQLQQRHRHTASIAGSSSSFNSPSTQSTTSPSLRRRLYHTMELTSKNEDRALTDSIEIESPSVGLYTANASTLGAVSLTHGSSSLTSRLPRHMMTLTSSPLSSPSSLPSALIRVISSSSCVASSSNSSAVVPSNDVAASSLTAQLRARSAARAALAGSLGKEEITCQLPLCGRSQPLLNSVLVPDRSVDNTDWNADVPSPEELRISHDKSFTIGDSTLRLERAASLSVIDHMPRSFLNSIEILILKSAMNDIEQRLYQHDEALSLHRSSAASSGQLNANILSSAMHYALKRQLAVLKAKMKREERLIGAMNDPESQITVSPLSRNRTLPSFSNSIEEGLVR